MTVSISDMTVPPQKPEMIKNAQDTVDKITKNFKRGLITEEERYKEVVETWKATDDALTKALEKSLCMKGYIVTLLSLQRQQERMNGQNWGSVHVGQLL